MLYNLSYKALAIRFPVVQFKYCMIKRNSCICYAKFLVGCFLFLCSAGWLSSLLALCQRVVMMSFTAAEEIESSELGSWQGKMVLHLISKQVFK